jgi:hypothetical protein
VEMSIRHCGDLEILIDTGEVSVFSPPDTCCAVLFPQDNKIQYCTVSISTVTRRSGLVLIGMGTFSVVGGRARPPRAPAPGVNRLAQGSGRGRLTGAGLDSCAASLRTLAQYVLTSFYFTG